MDICTIIRKINWYRVGDFITFILPWILAIGLMVGCSTIKYVPINDVTKIEYRDTTIFIKDTITVEIPKEVIKEVVPQDTVSILRTSVATSEAKVEKGMLTHTLEQKGKIATTIDTFFVTTIKEVEKMVEVPIEVEVIKYKRDTIFWFSIILNVMVILLICFRLYLKFKV